MIDIKINKYIRSGENGLTGIQMDKKAKELCCF